MEDKRLFDGNDLEFSLEEIGFVAERLMQCVKRGQIIAFYGGMGVGKTTLIKALCSEIGVDQVVTSPTFTLVNEYKYMTGQKSIFHFDFYRIENPSEIYDIGYEDYFFGDNICLIEWPERIEELLPDETVRLLLDVLPDGRRRLSEVKRRITTL